MTLLKRTYEEELGPRGIDAWKLSIRKDPQPRQQYSMTLISAITQKESLANQFVEGGVSAEVFEKFIYHLLKEVRERPEMKDRTVVVVLDNARIHHSDALWVTAKRFGVFLLFSAEYSPWLQAIERNFWLIKCKLTHEELRSR